MLYAFNDKEGGRRLNRPPPSVFLNEAWRPLLRARQVNGSRFYCSVPDCNGAQSRGDNPRLQRASLPGTFEATRNRPMACGRKHAICNRDHPSGRHNRAHRSVFDTIGCPFCPSLAPKNEMLWPYLPRSGDPSPFRIHRRHVGNRNLHRGMKSNPIVVWSFLLIFFSSSAPGLFL